MSKLVYFRISSRLFHISSLFGVPWYDSIPIHLLLEPEPNRGTPNPQSYHPPPMQNPFPVYPHVPCLHDKNVKQSLSPYLTLRLVSVGLVLGLESEARVARTKEHLTMYKTH